MGKIQDAHRLRGMDVDEGLAPVGPVHHRGDAPGRLQAAPIQLDWACSVNVALSVRREKYDQLAVWQTGPAGVGLGGGPRPPPTCAPQSTGRARSGIMAPSTLNVSASGPAGGAGWCVSRYAAAWVSSATCTRPGGLGEPPRGFAPDVDVGKVGQFGRGFGKRGDPGAQADQTFLQARGEAAGQQGQFLIQGEKARSHRPGRRRSCVPGCRSWPPWVWSVRGC